MFRSAGPIVNVSRTQAVKKRIQRGLVVYPKFGSRLTKPRSNPSLTKRYLLSERLFLRKASGEPKAYSGRSFIK